MSNARRDEENLKYYRDAGWKTLIIWECALKGKTKLPLAFILDLTAHWIIYEKSNFNIHGKTENSVANFAKSSDHYL